MLEDVALMRAIPGMRVVCRPTYVEARRRRAGRRGTPGPVYVRMGRDLGAGAVRARPGLELGRALLLRPGAT